MENNSNSIKIISTKSAIDKIEKCMIKQGNVRSMIFSIDLFSLSVIKGRSRMISNWMMNNTNFWDMIHLDSSYFSQFVNKSCLLQDREDELNLFARTFKTFLEEKEQSISRNFKMNLYANGICISNENDIKIDVSNSIQTKFYYSIYNKITPESERRFNVDDNVDLVISKDNFLNFKESLDSTLEISLSYMTHSSEGISRCLFASRFNGNDIANNICLVSNRKYNAVINSCGAIIILELHGIEFEEPIETIKELVITMKLPLVISIRQISVPLFSFIYGSVSLDQYKYRMNNYKQNANSHCSEIEDIIKSIKGSGLVIQQTKNCRKDQSIQQIRNYKFPVMSLTNIFIDSQIFEQVWAKS